MDATTLHSTLDDWTQAHDTWLRQAHDLPLEEALRCRVELHALELTLHSLGQQLGPSAWLEAGAAAQPALNDACQWLDGMQHVEREGSMQVMVTGWMPWAVLAEDVHDARLAFEERLQEVLMAAMRQAQQEAQTLGRAGMFHLETAPGWSIDALPPLAELVDDPWGDGVEMSRRGRLEGEDAYGVRGLRLWADTPLNLTVLREAVNAHLAAWDDQLTDDMDNPDGGEEGHDRLWYVAIMQPDVIGAVGAVSRYRWFNWLDEHLGDAPTTGVPRLLADFTVRVNGHNQPTDIEVAIRQPGAPGSPPTWVASLAWPDIEPLGVHLQELLWPFFEGHLNHVTWSVTHPSEPKAAPAARGSSYRMDEAWGSTLLN